MPTYKIADSARLLTFFSSCCCVKVRRSFCLLLYRSSSVRRQDTLLRPTQAKPLIRFRTSFRGVAGLVGPDELDIAATLASTRLKAHLPGGHFFGRRTSQNAVKRKFAERPFQAL